MQKRIVLSFVLFTTAFAAQARQSQKLSFEVAMRTMSSPQQSADARRFEAVSIKPFVSTGTPLMFPNGWTPFLPGGKFTHPVVSLKGLIAYAYSVRHPDMQIVGLPPWAQTSLFSVEATPGEALKDISPERQRGQMLLMLQTMLSDRFSLKIHVEERPADIYELRLAGGLKGMTQTTEGVAKPGLNPGLNAAIGDSSGQMIGNGATLQGVADGLMTFVGRPVVDKTGVSGYYNFDIHWTTERAPGAPTVPGLGAEGITLLMTELRDQLGLRLVSAKGTQQIWVVDQAEKLSDRE
jgi:uncharacterized protein (TIGR03435 family)